MWTDDLYGENTAHFSYSPEKYGPCLASIKLVREGEKYAATLRVHRLLTTTLYLATQDVELAKEASLDLLKQRVSSVVNDLQLVSTYVALHLANEIKELA